MDIAGIVADLKAQRSRVENVIAALEGINSSPRRGRPPKAQSKPAKSRKHKMSAAGRKRLSLAMKLRWKKWKGKSAPAA
jgi:hypothetical protein